MVDESRKLRYKIRNEQEQEVGHDVYSDLIIKLDDHSFFEETETKDSMGVQHHYYSIGNFDAEIDVYTAKNLTSGGGIVIEGKDYEHIDEMLREILRDFEGLSLHNFSVERD
jgi:hypothetical protein